MNRVPIETAPVPRCAVMGHPIAHSLSPAIHQCFATQTGLTLRYDKIDVSEALFESAVMDFLQAPDGKGLNVTLPFKTRAYAMAKVKSARCRQAGAANTLWIEDSVLHADNTDGVGFIRDILRFVDLKNKTVVLLGAGGAARGVLLPLLAAGPERVIVSNRTLEKTESLKKMAPAITTCALAALTDAYDVIINATSLSLQHDALGLPDTMLVNRPFCYDLAYTLNGITPFIQWAAAHGSEAVDGLGMLIEQAAESFWIWHQVKPDTSLIRSIIQKMK